MRLISTVLMACLAGSALAQPRRSAESCAAACAYAIDNGVRRWRNHTESIHGGGCASGSPMLAWSDVPAGVVTFVMIMHDTDVAAQKKAEDNLHWMVFNIPASTTGLPESVPPTVNLPDGAVQAKHSRGAVGYMAPGAPAGPYHHYIFELYGLDTKLDVGPDATRRMC